MTTTLLATAMEKIYHEVVEESSTELPVWFTKENGQREFIERGDYITMTFPDLELVSDFLNRLELIPLQIYGDKLMRINEGTKMISLFGMDNEHFLRGVLYTLHFFAPGGTLAQLSISIVTNIEIWRRDIASL